MEFKEVNRNGNRVQTKPLNWINLGRKYKFKHLWLLRCINSRTNWLPGQSVTMTAISTNCCLKNLHAARKLKWKMPTRISETNHQGSCGPLKCIHAGLGRALILRRMNPHVCQIFDTRKLVYGIEPQGSL